MTGVWYHVAVVKNSTSFSLYINGVLEDTRSPVPAFVNTDTTNLRLGSFPLLGSYLNGEIDEVEIYNRALSAADIAAIYNPPIDDTPPVITPTVTGTLGADGWYTSDVTLIWDVSDAQSAVSGMSGCEYQVVTADTPALTFTCSATSAGGSATRQVTIKRDATPPVITFAGNAGSYTVDQTVTITCSATDAMSGLASSSCPSPSGIAGSFGLGTHTLAATATDHAGLTASASATFTVSTRTPPNESACKEDGWKTYTRADLSEFKSQGDCIQYVNTGK